MAKKKGGKKGKKKVELLPVLTTIRILENRASALAPRLGDSFFNLNQQSEEQNEQAMIRIINAIERKSKTIALNHMRLINLSILSNTSQYEIDFDLNSLQEIDLSRNQLYNTEDVFMALSNLPNLKIINLSDNYLNGSLSPPPGKFLNLEDLNVNNNQLNSFSVEISSWTSMKKFQIAGNLLKEIPNDLTCWRQLAYIDMRRNKITEVHDSMCQSWTMMEKMYFGSNSLKKIPENIGSIISLIELDFSNNSIDEIPISLSQCVLLQNLHLGNNKIKNFPPEVFAGLTSLKELQLFKNKIVTLPSEINTLTDLERMSLSSNNIKKLPEEIGGCTNLKELYINNNTKFSTVPTSIGELKRLEELSAIKCPALKQLPATITELPNLEMLDLRPVKKPVCKITPEMFQALSEHCIVRGHLIKKAKGKGKGKKKK